MDVASSHYTTVPLLAVVLIASGYDLLTRKIPNHLIVAAFVFGVASGFWKSGVGGMLHALAGFAVGLMLLLPGFLMRFTGGGDVKLLAAIGSMTGAGSTLHIFVVTVLLGAVIFVSCGVLSYLRGQPAAALHRYADMVRHFFATGQLSYVRPEPGEVAATRIPLAPLLALGTIVIVLDLINIGQLTG